MTKELHKRLEEESLIVRTEIINGLPIWWLSEPIDKATNRGIELGYKEAIAQAKEWLMEHLPTPDWYSSTEEFVTDFETYMNKLLEEKK